MSVRLDWARDGRDWPNRAASRFVTAGGLRWHVQAMGAGPAVLLLHGTGASTHSWRDVAPALAAHATVIALDLPGHGFTETPPSRGLTLPAMAAGVAALVRALEFAPEVIVGHSAGAAIAVRMAIDELAAPRALVSLNGALKPFPGATGLIFPSLAKLLFMNPVAPHFFAAGARDPAAVERLIAQTGSHIDVGGLDMYRRLFRSPGHVAATLGMMAQWDLVPLQADLPRLKTPIALVYGENDQAVAPQVARECAERFSDAKLLAWPGVGHLAHEERPDRAAEIILDALKT
jgi:magnesium chelatase accessory protein